MGGKGFVECLKMLINRASAGRKPRFCYVESGGEKMDAQKFGAFVAAVRRENHMTQAELAAKIQVTDKAVSRWERGLGFPDINTLIPLADALGLSVLELMQSEKIDEKTLSGNQANEAMTDTLDIAVKQRKAERKRLWLIAGIAAMLVLAVLLLDDMGWDFGMAVMYAVVIIPPIFSIIAGVCFLFYLIWQLRHHRAIKQTVIALLVCTAILIAWILLPVIIVLLGGFPVPS